MSFRWQRTGALIASTCSSCVTVLTCRDEPDLLRAQRAHQAAVCGPRILTNRALLVGAALLFANLTGHYCAALLTHPKETP